MESNAKNASVFISVSVGDNIAMVAYAKDELGLKSGVVLQTGDTQGKYSGEIISTAMEGAGMSTKVITVSPTASDLSAPAAEAVSSGAELVYIETPNECAAMMKALESVGNTATVAADRYLLGPGPGGSSGPGRGRRLLPGTDRTRSPADRKKRASPTPRSKNSPRRKCRKNRSRSPDSARS